MSYAKSVLIALDQLANALFMGWPDETVSSRSWRWHVSGVRHWPCRVLDCIFGPDHCRESFESERQGRQLPPEARRRQVLEGHQGGLVLRQKWEDFAQYLFETVLRDLPKSERFTMGADIRRILWDVQAACVQLSLYSGPRRQLLNAVDVQSKVLESIVKTGIRIKAIPQKRESVVAEKIAEIGRIVGGLLKVRQ